MAAPVALALRSLGFVPLVDFEVTQDGGATRVMWLSAQPQPTQATLDAITEEQAVGAIATRIAQAAKAAASASIDRGARIDADLRERIEAALVAAIRDEFNRHSTLEAAMFAAVAAAASLADLKTRYAAIQQIPQRSLADLVASIKAVIAVSDE